MDGSDNTLISYQLKQAIKTCNGQVEQTKKE